MKLILGLGNPGRSYEQTRHNVGWWVLDHLADVWHLGGWRQDGQALVTSGRVDSINVRLMKPLTYMNLSGKVLVPYLRRPFWSPATDLLVVVDDVALPLGRYRLRARGSAGGHNGLKSVEQAIGSREYPRLRIGIHPPNRSASSASWPTSSSRPSARSSARRSWSSCRASPTRSSSGCARESSRP